MFKDIGKEENATISKVNELMVSAWVKVCYAMKKMKDERGDTNLISIIIVLGIVLALVVVFRGYISTIIEKIKNSVTNFNNNAF